MNWEIEIDIYIYIHSKEGPNKMPLLTSSKMHKEIRKDSENN